MGQLALSTDTAAPTWPCLQTLLPYLALSADTAALPSFVYTP